MESKNTVLHNLTIYISSKNIPRSMNIFFIDLTVKLEKNSYLYIYKEYGYPKMW